MNSIDRTLIGYDSGPHQCWLIS